LGLAWSQQGGLGGEVLSFQGTLPIYVDPVVPPQLRAGDRLRLPVQVVNTTGEALRADLRVSVEGAARADARGQVSVPANGSVVQAVDVVANGSGEARLSASLAGRDALIRTVNVLPTGRPLELGRGGTLASARSFPLSGPADLDPESACIRLVVVPGALALLRSELAEATSRGGVADDAASLLLTARAPALLAALGADVDQDALRNTRLIATQRVIRHARSPDPGTAALLAQAALAWPDEPLLQRLGQRLADQLAAEQRPDGTFGGGHAWTLQQVLVATAEGTAAVRATPNGRGDIARTDKNRQAAVQLRAAAAFERHAGHIDDPYTAASVLVSGAVNGELRTRLVKVVTDAVRPNPDGSRSVPVPDDVLRPDGNRPSEAEVTALAVLALAGTDAPDWLPDLGAWLLGAWRPGAGWGDGRANLVGLGAVSALFDDPLPPDVRIVVTMDGQPVTEGRISGDQRGAVLVLDAPAPGARGTHTWGVEAVPPVPGLGFRLDLRTWVPWEKSPVAHGLELQASTPSGLAVGRTSTVELQAAAPARTAFTVRQELPAGVQVVESSLEALVSAGSITAWRTADGEVELDGNPLVEGQVFAARYEVVPTLAGTLSSGPSRISPKGRSDLAVVLPPVRWTVQ
jgi:hypothetical protein